MIEKSLEVIKMLATKLETPENKIKRASVLMGEAIVILRSTGISKEDILNSISETWDMKFPS